MVLHFSVKISLAGSHQIEKRNSRWSTDSTVFKEFDFEKSLNALELRAWDAFKRVCSNFLGNFKAPLYQTGSEKLLAAFKKMGCRMSLKMHSLSSHLQFFSKKLGPMNHEHGEKFHQHLKAMEERC